MRLREGKAPRSTLGILAVLAGVTFGLVEQSKVEVKHPHYKDMRQAVKYMSEGLSHLRDEKARRGLPLDPEDPFGLLGEEDSIITTDKGDQNAKLVSANPLMAAVMVDLLAKAKVQPDDTVAIGCTGSFPGANLAVYSACRALRLRPIIITSIGASTWGANHSKWTWLDMEKVLASEGATRFRSVASSLGGSKDRALGLSRAGIDLLRQAAERNGVPLVDQKTLEGSIQERMRIYDEVAKGKPIKAYINIGGGLASLGARVNALKHLQTGVNLDVPTANYPTKGVAILFGQRKPGVPVVHILDVVKLAKMYHLPTSVRGKSSEELVVEEKILFEERYNVGITVLATILLALVTFFLIRIDLRNIGRTRPLSPAELAGAPPALAEARPPSTAPAPPPQAHEATPSPNDQG